ncbi:MAG: alpha-amylase, partial [Alistipes sp.]|nr:alpha-amylase [Alistipes sp.]
AKLAGAVLLTSCGSPYIYYGEELGYVGRKDNGDEYLRSPMKWGDASTTTYMDKIYTGMNNVKDVPAQSDDESSMLNVYRTFSQLRNTYPALAVGEMKLHAFYNADNTQYKQIAAWYREQDDQRMLVIHNFSSTATTVSVDDEIDRAVAVLNSVSANYGSTTTVRLGGYSSVVFLLK